MCIRLDISQEVPTIKKGCPGTCGNSNCASKQAMPETDEILFLKQAETSPAGEDTLNIGTEDVAQG